MNEHEEPREYPSAGHLRHQAALRKFSMIIYAIMLDRVGVKNIRLYPNICDD